MRKVWPILCLLLSLLLTGCTETEIICGVDREKCAFLTVSVESDWEGLGNMLRRDLEDGMDRVAKHYEKELGFTVEKAYTSEGGSLRMTLKRPAESYEAAFEGLKALLTDETITPFLQVNLQQTDHDLVQGFGMEVTLDAGRMLENLGLEELPGDLQADFTQSLAESSAQLCLVLPASGLVSGPDGTTCEEGVARAEVPVDLRGQTQAKLSTQAVIRDGEVVLGAEQTYIEQIQRLEQLVWAIGALLMLILATAGALFLASRKRKKPTQLN